MLIWSPHDNPFILRPDADPTLTSDPGLQRYLSWSHTSQHSAPSFLSQKCTVCDEPCCVAQWSNCVSVPRGEAWEVERIVARMCSSQANAKAHYSVTKCVRQRDFNVQLLYIKHSLCRAKWYIRLACFKATKISSRCRRVRFFYERKTHTWTWNDKQ